MIPRAPEEAEKRQHDLIIVGGGIYGCLLTLESARRGLRPLLLERDDFGQHTSGSWLRILHGGLRYLQTLDLARHRESVQERRWFLQHFPEFVEPLRCVMPLYGRGLRRRSPMAVALTANDALSWARRADVGTGPRLPAGRTLSNEQVLALAPSIRADGLRGGAQWHDAVVRRPQRLLMEVIRWAVAEGASVANHVEVLRLQEAGGRITGVLVADALAERELTFQAPVVVNCAGPWSDRLATELDRSVPGLFHPSLAFNLLLDREPDFEGALAVEAPAPGARTHFMYPAYGGILAGTFHGPIREGRPGEATTQPTPEMIEAFRSELHDAVPRLDLASASVLHVFSGQLPVRRPGTVELSRRPAIHHHGDHGGVPGLVSVSGVKFTTARSVARRVLSELAQRGQIQAGTPSHRPRPEAMDVPEADMLQTAGSERIRDLTRVFASSEAARMADDVLLRRTDWGLDPTVNMQARDVVDDALSAALRSLDEERP